MPRFDYQVRDQKGRKVRGTIEALSRKVLADRFVREGYLISSINQRSTALQWFDRLTPEFVSSEDLITFYDQLATLLEAGVTLLNALQSLSELIESRNLRRAIQQIAVSIESGESLSEAMARLPHIFPALVCKIISVGERSGNLSKVMSDIALLEEAKSELFFKVRSALAYPAVLLAASCGVIVLMVTWLVPSFVEVFNRSGIALPLPTRILYSASLFVKAHPYVIPAIVLGMTALGAVALSYVPIRRLWHRMLLKIPVAGPLFFRVTIVRWVRSMEIMLSSGIPVLEALEIAEKVVHNLFIQGILARISQKVREGGKIAEAFKQFSEIPSDMVQILATGEQSGTLDQMCGKVAVFYDRSVQRSLKKLTSMIEPILILFIGILIGFIMLSVLLPIFDMIKVFRTH